VGKGDEEEEGEDKKSEDTEDEDIMGESESNGGKTPKEMQTEKKDEGHGRTRRQRKAPNADCCAGQDQKAPQDQRPEGRRRTTRPVRRREGWTRAARTTITTRDSRAVAALEAED
jgi:hypothetical protein